MPRTAPPPRPPRFRPALSFALDRVIAALDVPPLCATCRQELRRRKGALEALAGLHRTPAEVK